MFLGEAFDSKFSTRLKNFFKNSWNVFDLIMYTIFYVGVVFRFWVNIFFMGFEFKLIK